MVPSLDPATSESYVWAYPGCPIRILFSLSVIDQLQAEIAESVASGGEIGGLLIGRRKSEPNTIRIVDFIPLQGERKGLDPRFKLPPDSLAEAIARCPSDCKIVGYYRTDIDQSIRLRPPDLGTIQQWFKDPANVFLVIAPADGPRATAGFFFWENGMVSANSGLSFPFAAARLVAEGWPMESGPPRKEKPRSGGGALQKTLNLAARLSLPMKIAAISFFFVLVIGIRLFTWSRSDSVSNPAASSLGLHVARAGNRFLVSWNPSARDILNAKEATLVIWDSSRQMAGSNAPLYMPLTPAQLRFGSVTYLSLSFVEKIRFRLDTSGKNGAGSSESMVSLAPEPGASTFMPALPADTRAPYPPRRSTLAKPANKNFVPPRVPGKVAEAVDTTVPQPPKIAQPNTKPAFTQDAPSTTNSPAATQNAGSAPASLSVGPQKGLSTAGMVTITSEPSGAAVEINGIPQGLTPVTLQIGPAGQGFTVSVSKSGFLKWTVQSFSAAQPFSLHAQLKLDRK